MHTKDADTGTFRDSIQTQLWPIPLAAVLLAVALGQFLPLLDQVLEDDLPALLTGFLFGGGPGAARSLLETISSSMITVTSLTFSLTVVTLQLASSQFSPRLLRTFTRDRIVQSTLALFVATFAYALTVLRSIRVETDDDPGFVPELAVTLAFVLALASVGGLVLFLAHLARQIRVESMLHDVYREANRTLERIFPTDREPFDASVIPHGPATAVAARSSGFLLSLDRRAALAAAVVADAFVVVDATPGASLVKGVPYARAWGTDGTALAGERLEKLEEELGSAASMGFERTSAQDATFGLQQLLDVANKALSPGVNDPTTAVHALGHVSAVLCAVGTRTTGAEAVRDDDGRVRIVLTYPTFAQLLDLVLDQLITYAFADPRAAERTLAMLQEIAVTSSDGARVPHRDALLRHAARARTAIDRSDLDAGIRDQLLTMTARLEESLRGPGLRTSDAAAAAQVEPASSLREPGTGRR